MVYVDGMRAAYRRMVMCHMASDTHEELLQMADRIGVQRKWLQHRGTYMEHFDVCLAKRNLAVQFGAMQVSTKDLVRMMRKRKDRGA